MWLKSNNKLVMTTADSKTQWIFNRMTLIKVNWSDLSSITVIIVDKSWDLLARFYRFRVSKTNEGLRRRGSKKIREIFWEFRIYVMSNQSNFPPSSPLHRTSLINFRFVYLLASCGFVRSSPIFMQSLSVMNRAQSPSHFQVIPPETKFTWLSKTWSKVHSK